MEQLRTFVANYNIEIVLGLIVALFVLFILYIIAEIRISRIRKRYNEFTMGVKGVNVEELLIRTGEDLNNIRVDINVIEKDISKLETKLAFAIQKVGFVRYNAFAEMGSQLSFSITLLDKFNNGFVLTSIYGRDHTTSYGKPIKFGKSVYPLSVEEMQSIDRAIMGEYNEKNL